MEIDPEDMYAMVLYQVGALKAIMDAEGVELHHIKPHGELFFYMQRDLTIMRAVLKACKLFNVPVYGAKSMDEKQMCEELGILFIEEVYVDIDYGSKGQLIPVAQSQKASPDDVYRRTLSMGLTDTTIDQDGNELRMGFDKQCFSVCIHSDMPTALENAKASRRAVDEINTKKGLV